MNEEQWLLVSASTGHRLLLPHSMIFVGRSDSDIILQSRSVEKHHSVITYDHYDKTFKLKDLKSVNGTYLNDVRIPEQTYVQLQHLDTLRFGHDHALFRVQRIPSPAWAASNTQTSTSSLHGSAGRYQHPRPPIEHREILRSSCRYSESRRPSSGPGYSNWTSMTQRMGSAVENVEVEAGPSCGSALHGKHANLSGDSLDSVGDWDLKHSIKHLALDRSNVSMSNHECKYNGAKEAERAKLCENDSPKEELQQLHIVESPSSGKNVLVPAEKPYTDEEKVNGAAVSWPSCTAFTVDFDDMKTSNKKFDIRDSISKFAPPKSDSERPTHKRSSSASGSKTEDPKDLDSYSDENGNLSGDWGNCLLDVELERDRDPRNRVSAMRKDAISEGHISASDQDDEISAKSDPPRVLTKAYDLGNLKVLGKHAKLSTRNPGSSRRKKIDKPGPVSDSASYLIEKMFNSNCDVHEMAKTDPMPSNLVRDAKGGSHNSLNSNVTYVVPLTSGSWEASKSHTFPKSHKAVGMGKDQVVEEERDNGSEAGTYTIDKDSPNPEVEEARCNIEKVFGLVQGEEDVQVDHKNGFRNTVVSPGRTEVIERWFKDSEVANGTVGGDKELGRHCGPLWTNEWPRPLSPSVRHGSAPLLSSPVDPVKPRPPTRLHSKSTKSPNESVQSESSLENTERLLKDTENVVTAMEARMRSNQGRKKSLETKDSSGADSDLDTSAASGANELNGKAIGSPSRDRAGSSKNLGAILTAKLRKLDEELRELNQDRRVSSKSPVNLKIQQKPSSASAQRSSVRKSRSNDSYSLPGRESMSETASVLSDVSSSSDMSGSSPGGPLRNKKGRSGSSTPTMRFNRAFSLRRARLGYDSDAGAPAKSAARPSSAGASEGRRRLSTNSNRSDSGASVESGPNNANQRPHNGAQPTNFARSDGGRFSLRLPRNATPPLTKQKVAKLVPPVKANVVAVSKPKSAPPKLAVTVPGSRSTSNLCSKEAELKNWKRRKEYDPMKAAAEGRKKDINAKKGNDGHAHSDNDVPTMQRSASFHGTDDFASCQDQEPAFTKVAPRSHTRKSFEDESSSLDQASPVSQSEISSASEHNHSALKGFSAHLPKHKTRLEPIDSLLIGKINQLAQKLKGNAEFTLKRLKDKHVTESSFHGWLEELLANVADRDSPASPHGHTLSRELTVTFKNLKKLEECLEAIDQVVQLLSLHPVNPSSKSNHNGSNSSRQLCSDTQSKWNAVDGDEYY